MQKHEYGYELLDSLRTRIEEDDLGPEVVLTYRISGGYGPTRIVTQFRLQASGDAEGTTRRGSGEEARSTSARSRLDPETTRRLIRELADSFEELIPRSEFRCVPDAVKGSVTIEIGDRKVTRFFYPTGRDQDTYERPLGPKVLKVRESLREVRRTGLGEEEPYV